MSAVAVQRLPGFHPTFQQNRHSATPPAALLTPAKNRTPGIITLSKPTNQRSPRQRRASPSQSQSPKEKSRKPRSKSSSDEEEHESKARGRRSNAEKSPSASPAPVATPAAKRRSQPSPESDPTPQLEKPSGRLARRRGGFTKSTPSLCEVATPVAITQMSNSASHPAGLSRSAPMPTCMPQSLPARMRRTPTSNGREEKEVPPSPSPRRVRESKAPLTAPLSGGFPRPAHNRSPSEAMFNLSLDDSEDDPQAMPVLFRNRSSGDKVYAGGRFQNGPDTTTLPAPSFLSGL